MKAKSFWVLLVAIAILGLVAVGFIVNNVDASMGFKESITVNGAGVAEESFSVKGLDLVPTGSKEYEIEINSKLDGKFEISLEYKEKKDGGLKSYVNVTVSCDNEVVYHDSLQNLLNDYKLINFSNTLSIGSPLKITIVYSMPSEVGNEAQGTSADFDITLKVKKA